MYGRFLWVFQNVYQKKYVKEICTKMINAKSLFISQNSHEKIM